MSQMTEGVEAKDMGLLARFYYLTIMSPVTKFIYLPKCNNGTTSGIIKKKLNNSLWSHVWLYGWVGPRDSRLQFEIVEVLSVVVVVLCT